MKRKQFEKYRCEFTFHIWVIVATTFHSTTEPNKYSAFLIKKGITRANIIKSIGVRDICVTGGF